MAELIRPEKDKTYWKILNAALYLDFRKGHQRWTMSELSRKAAVTRSLLYYYFGKSREGILDEAVQIVGEEIFGLTEKKRELWSQGKMDESVLGSRKLMEETPHLGAFYLMHRSQSSRLGESIRALERRYSQKLKVYFPHLNEADRGALFALLLGLVFAPGISDEAVRKAVGLAKEIILKDKPGAEVIRTSSFI